MLDRESYSQGFADGVAFGRANPAPSPFANTMANEMVITKGLKKRKRMQSPKQKLLTEMTAKKWNQYKKGKGKKTYVEIRAQVSRSQEYKRKAKKL